MKKLIDQNEAQIVMSEDGRKKMLLDSEGWAQWEFSPDWTDEQITSALHFANRAYSLGHDCGVRRNQNDLRKALGVSDSIDFAMESFARANGLDFER